MRARLATLCLLLLIPILAACGSSEDALAEDLADVYDEMADVMDGIDDAESIEEAQPRMREIAQTMRALRDEWESAIEDGDAEDLVKSTQNTELLASMQRMQQSMMKIAMNPALAPKMGELMKEFADVFDEK